MISGMIALSGVVNVAAIAGTVTGAEDLSASSIVEYVIKLGVETALLVLFVVVFIKRTQSDSERVEKANQDSRKQLEAVIQQNREREKTLMSESAKREEILRAEAEKRETMLRREAEKRESILMANQDRMVDSMGQITKSLAKIEVSLNKMEARHESDINQIKDKMQKMDSKIDRMGGQGQRNG